MREALVRLVRLLVALFYRRVEVTGAERIPAEGPVLLVANHVNGLVDPALALTVVRRPVVFVAKATLWKVPVLRAILDVLGAVPIYRRQDAAETGGTRGNEGSMERLARVLAGGGAVLIFPEGRSHSDPMLSDIKTGAARILQLSGTRAAVVPVGMLFTRKEEFRSDVLLSVGEPFEVDESAGQVQRGAARERVDAVTERIRELLSAVTLNAPSWEEHEVISAVESIWGERLDPAPPSLERTFRNRRILLEARGVLERLEPGAVARLSSRARALARLLEKAGLRPEDLDAPASRRLLRLVVRSLPDTLLGAPLALPGILVFFLPYHLCALASKPLRARGLLDQIALAKIVVGAVGHGAMLAVATAGAFAAGGPWAALAAAALLPVSGLFALGWLEAVGSGGREARLLLAQLLGAVRERDGLAFLRRERDALRAECDRLADVFRATTTA